MTLNIDGIIKNVRDTVCSHRLDGEGRYARWLWQNDKNNRRLGLNEYGCADAANILYTIGDFPSENKKREQWIETLQAFQNPTTGLFTEETHHFIHTTAHCIAALELFDTKPRYPLTDLMIYSNRQGLYDLLDGLDWKNAPWPQSHQGAGIYAAMILTESVDDQWSDDYFKWLWENADPETGLWKKNAVKAGTAMIYEHMGGTFHYLFNHEYAHRPLRYPEKLIDTCLSLYEEHTAGRRERAFGNYNFGRRVGFLEADWVYCLNRANRQTGYRFNDSRKALNRFAAEFTDFLSGLNAATHDEFNDLHMLFGAVCTLAELQQALPGTIKCRKPLKLVLDRRPFI